MRSLWQEPQYCATSAFCASMVSALDLPALSGRSRDGVEGNAGLACWAVPTALTSVAASAATARFFMPKSIGDDGRKRCLLSSRDCLVLSQSAAEGAARRLLSRKHRIEVVADADLRPERRLRDELGAIRIGD